MKQLFLLRGLPGSGKSTWIKKMGLVPILYRQISCEKCMPALNMTLMEIWSSALNAINLCGAPYQLLGWSETGGIRTYHVYDANAVGGELNCYRSAATDHPKYCVTLQCGVK